MAEPTKIKVAGSIDIKTTTPNVVIEKKDGNK